MAVAVEGVDMSPGPVGEQGQALKHYFLAGLATVLGAGQVKAGSRARWVSVWEVGSRFLPARGRWLRWRRSQPLSQASRPVEGNGESGHTLQACVRATMGLTARWAGSRDALAALEEEWAVEGMRGTVDGGDEHEGLWHWITWSGDWRAARTPSLEP